MILDKCFFFGCDFYFRKVVRILGAPTFLKMFVEFAIKSVFRSSHILRFLRTSADRMQD